jgi:hypothetical protein
MTKEILLFEAVGFEEKPLEQLKHLDMHKVHIFKTRKRKYCEYTCIANEGYIKEVCMNKAKWQVELFLTKTLILVSYVCNIHKNILLKYLKND